MNNFIQCNREMLIQKLKKLSYEEFLKISEDHYLATIPMGVAIEVQAPNSTLWNLCPWCIFNEGPRIYNFVENGECSI
nr:hypothetical protein [Candidatus Gracilibacteria bacterium]